MRLGQLARQLAINPDELVNYLANREIALESHPNTRLEDKHVELILQHFAPGNDELRQQVQEQLPDSAEPLEAAPTEDAAPPELIKAPKVELPGLRVVGKIELPEKKKPEPKPDDSTRLEAADGTAEGPGSAPPEQRAERKERRPSTPSQGYTRRNQPPRDRKNPITLQREQEERERKRKLEEARERDKERRAQYYQKRLKPQVPTKAVRLVDEEVEEMPALEPERPKTLWGRFKRWLNT